MSLVVYFLELTIIVFIGILVACHLFSYHIFMPRKLGAAASFGLLSAIPIPFPLANILLPAIAMYVCLMDQNHDRSTVNKVFGATYIFAILVTLVLVKLNS